MREARLEFRLSSRSPHNMVDSIVQISIPYHGSAAAELVLYIEAKGVGKQKQRVDCLTLEIKCHTLMYFKEKRVNRLQRKIFKKFAIVELS